METRSTEDELLALSSLLASPSSKPARAGQAISPQRFPRVDEVTFQGGEPGGVMRRQAPRTAATTTTTMPAKYWPAERGALADEVHDEYEGRSEYHASACRADADADAEDLLIAHSSALLDRGVDACAANLKRELLTAFTAARGALGDHYADLVLRAREEQASQCAVLQREVDELKELLQTYTTSSHTKDQVIANLKQALDHERAAAAQKEAELAEKHVALDAQREHASNLIATRHYQSTQRQKCFRALRAQVEKKWKGRLEKACKIRAKEVCSQLAEEYEAKIRFLQLELDEANAEVMDYQRKQADFQAGMKQAFMRGVSALNMETMTMFNATVGHGPTPTSGQDGGFDQFAAEIPRATGTAPAAADMGGYEYGPPSSGAAAAAVHGYAPPARQPSAGYLRQGISPELPVSRPKKGADPRPTVRIERHYRPRTARIVP